MELDTTMSFGQLQFTTLIVSVIAMSVWFFRRTANGVHKANSTSGTLPLTPEIPGLPVIGNLLQLKEKKPHKTFTRWADKYGPIYSIRTGSNRLVILNSNDVAKEAMVTRFASISTRKLPHAIKIITDDKKIVTMTDYGEFHNTVKRHLHKSTLGPNAQKRHRSLRDTLVTTVSTKLHACLEEDPLRAVNLRKIFESELFGLAMKEALGSDVESIYVEELGTTVSKDDMLQILVINQMKGVIEVDWRDFFPILKWIPNKSFEKYVLKIASERQAVMSALIREQKKRISRGEEVNCHLDYLLSDAKTLSEQQKLMLVWEIIVESSDTTLVTTEWTMYELAKDPEKQDRLYRDIQNICGKEKITEEKLSELPYLTAVFHETLRKYSPAPIIPLRFVHEDTQLGGYHIPAGTEIAINIFGCNMDKKVWENPEEWKPERFLDDKYEANDMYKTMAFGAGKRVCAGSLQAMLISCTTIGRLVQEFEWRLKEGEEENIDTVGLTTHKLHPMQAILKART